MEQCLEAEILAAFPEFLSEDGDTPEDCSFDCGDGWYQLIYDLCSKLATLGPETRVRISSAKETLGALRISAQTESEEARTLINDCEKQAGHTCETCGDQGRMHSYIHEKLMVRCDTCWHNYFEKMWETID